MLEQANSINSNIVIREIAGHIWLIIFQSPVTLEEAEKTADDLLAIAELAEKSGCKAICA